MTRIEEKAKTETKTYSYCISLWLIVVEYLYCISSLHIFIAYLDGISSFHVLIAHLHGIFFLRIFIAYLYRLSLLNISLSSLHCISLVDGLPPVLSLTIHSQRCYIRKLLLMLGRYWKWKMMNFLKS